MDESRAYGHIAPAYIRDSHCFILSATRTSEGIPSLAGAASTAALWIIAVENITCRWLAIGTVIKLV